MEVITIGRSPENNVVIGDPNVSRRHLQIIRDDYGNFRVKDLDSYNGVFVNGRRISGEVFLNPSDVIQIGNTVIPWISYFSDNSASRGGYMATGGYGKVNTLSSPPPKMPTTYLWQSIVVTILWCWPLGIPSIVYASQVEKRFLRGDYIGAQDASSNARTWLIVALSSGLLVVIIYIFYCVIVGVGIVAGGVMFVELVKWIF
jgi:hypothetical protein